MEDDAEKLEKVERELYIAIFIQIILILGALSVIMSSVIIGVNSEIKDFLLAVVLCTFCLIFGIITNLVCLLALVRWR